MRLAAALVVAFACLGVPALGQSIDTSAKGTLNNEAVVGMTKMGLADDVIVAQIQEAPAVDFNLETDDLVRLKEAGVKPEIVAAMITRAAVVPPKARPKSGKPHVDANFFLGRKTMESAWQPVDDPFEFGAVMSFGLGNWPVDIAVDLLGSEAGGCFLCLGTPATGKTFEVDAGVRKIWRKGKVLPYIGGGGSIIHAAFEISNGNIYANSSDVALGFWAGTGLLFRPGKIFEFGLDVRYSTANVDLNFGYGAQSVNAGGLHYGLLFGFGF